MNGKKKYRVRHNVSLWQAYIQWDELVQQKKKHLSRIAAIQRGDSQMDEASEWAMLDALGLKGPYDDDTPDPIEVKRVELMMRGESAGPIWDWVTSIKGLGSKYLAARLIALLDHPSHYATISKMWRFSGIAVINGQAERKNSTAYCRVLKSLLLGEKQIVEQFRFHHTPVYADIYYEYKARKRREHPVTECVQCNIPWDECTVQKKGKDKSKHHKMRYNDGHLAMMAKRKAAKVFLQHLWVKWRTFEGLEVSEPYVQAILGHTNIFTVEMLEDEVSV